MRKSAKQQPVSFWVQVLQDQIEREREEREAHEAEERPIEVP